MTIELTGLETGIWGFGDLGTCPAVSRESLKSPNPGQLTRRLEVRSALP